MREILVKANNKSTRKINPASEGNLTHDLEKSHARSLKLKSATTNISLLKFPPKIDFADTSKKHDERQVCTPEIVLTESD